MSSKDQLQEEYKALISEYGGIYQEIFSQHGFSIDNLQDHLKNLAVTYTNEAQAGTDEISFNPELQKKLNELLKNHQVNIETNPVEFGFNGLIQDMATEIEHLIVKAGVSFSHNVFAGEFPTGSFNAQIRPAANGFLVLINTGLMMFIYQTLKVMMYSAFDEGVNPIEYRNRVGNLSVAHVLSEIVLAYLTVGDPRYATRLPALGGTRMMLFNDFFDNCERFAVAHEYGHLIGGHLDEPKLAVSNTPVGELEIVKKEWQQEFEADVLGALILLRALPPIRNDYDFMKFKFVVSGPLIFFTLDELITKATMEILGLGNFVIVTDHPPAQLRIENLKKYFIQVAGTEAVLRIYDDFRKWLSFYEDEVVGNVKIALSSVQK
jgi:hypothetical protein